MSFTIAHCSCHLDSENTPPIRSSTLEASRRRRARSAGGPHHPKYAVEYAKHKNDTRHQPALINIHPPRSSPGVAIPNIVITSGVSTSAVYLPRFLLRPVSLRKITGETIASVAPELTNTSLPYIRDSLESLGPAMLHVLAGVEATPDPSVLPKELSVVVNDLSSDMPTHMFAVYSGPAPAATKCRVTLFPIHNIVFATHCTNLPMLPTSNVLRPHIPGSTISVPVVPLCIPAPDVFPQLSTFLYTKRIDHLLASLLPCPVPNPIYLDDPTKETVLDLLQHFSSKLATSYSAQTLLMHAMTVNGMWRNACALGINDTKLWCALDVAWEILVTALAN